MAETGKKNTERRYRIIAFSDAGYRLAARMAALLGEEGADASAERSGPALSAAQWTQRYFQKDACLVYVGACGIAVRSIAPFLKSKLEDPAVLVADEGGRFVIPVLSGHLGGANRDAERIAGLLHAQAVLTTGTDVRRRFAVDVWAQSQGLQILEPHRIVNVSSRVLNDRKGISVFSVWPVRGDRPAGVEAVLHPGDGQERAGGSLCREQADVVIDVRVRPEEKALHLVPRALALGIGCRKDISEEAVEQCWREFSARYGFPDAALQIAVSIDVKKNEQGILRFCSSHGIPFQTFHRDQLNAVLGPFSGSDFVRRTVGTDNVCERSAAAVCGMNSDCIIARKFSRNGVTMAAALQDVALSWTL